MEKTAHSTKQTSPTGVVVIFRVNRLFYACFMANMDVAIVDSEKENITMMQLRPFVFWIKTAIKYDIKLQKAYTEYLLSNSKLYLVTNKDRSLLLAAI